MGNINNSEVISNSSFAPFLARYVKFCPQRWNKEIALRVELYGCKAEGTFVNLVTKPLLKIKVLVSFKKKKQKVKNFGNSKVNLYECLSGKTSSSEG